jgi:GT2 family glycosyltransferase
VIPVRFASGGGLLVRRDVLEAVERFQGSYLDERLFLYGDDFALSLVASNLGYKPHLAKRATGHHRGMTSTGGKWGPIQFYYDTRNMFYVADNLPELERRRYRLLFPLTRMGRVVKYLAKGRYGCARAALWGMIDAYRGVTGKWREHDRQAGQARHGRFH